MNKLLIAVLSLAFSLPAFSGDVTDAVKAVKSAYEKGQLSASPFASVRLNDSDPDYGGGLAIGYAIGKNAVVEGEATSDGATSDDTLQTFLRDVGGNLKLYFPIKPVAGLAPYGIAGYRYDLDESEHQVAAGAGIEYRLKGWGVFADARFIQGLDEQFNAFGKRGLCRFGFTRQF